MLKLLRRYAFPLACLAALALALLIYLPGLPGSFVFDDVGSIVRNPAIRIRDLGFESLLQAALSSPGGGLMRPLSMLSFALDAYFFGLSPFAFKLTNILIHIANGLLLGLVARELLRTVQERFALSRREIEWLSLGIALLWCVHPLDLTAVLYAVQRETALAAFFSALALLSYTVARRHQRSRGTGRWLLWLCTPLAVGAAVFSKENAAIVPLLFLVIEFTLLRFRGRDGAPSRELWLFHGLFLLLPGLGLAALILLHPATLFASYVGRDYTMWERLLSESRILLDYLRWALLPDLKQLALFHDDIAPSRGLLQPATTLPSCLAVIVLLAAAFGLRRRAPLLSFGLLWFFAGHLIESTVLPLELAFEHRNYLPLFGLMLGTLGSLYLFARSRGEARLVAALFVIGVSAMAAATAVRASEWGNELDFALSESKHHPGSPRALSELEWAYLNYIVVTHDATLVPLAEDAARRSKAADPYSINQDVSLAYMYSKLQDVPNARRHLAAAAKGADTAHISATLQFSLQTLLDMAVPENQALFPDMRAVFDRALASPQLTTDACYTANLMNSYALFLDRIQDIPAAVTSLHKSVMLCPSNGQLRANFARLLLRYGDLKDARTELDALRALGDPRRSSELAELEADYKAQQRLKHGG
ncbi:MAG TPA: hypothetical protein VF651_11765 [Gammaproteobacteria bacterium]